jgi:hypothetical protein
MQRLEISREVQHIYIYIYMRRKRVNKHNYKHKEHAAFQHCCLFTYWLLILHRALAIRLYFRLRMSDNRTSAQGSIAVATSIVS